jgi:aspartate racemase
MKTIGLIGGTGWISTIEYYRIINDETNKRLGGLNAAKIILYSVNYSEIDKLNSQNDFEGVSRLLIERGKLIETAGADCLLLCANTLHLYADDVQSAVNIPVIHIASATGRIINKAGLKKIALVGTRYTMEKDFYKAKLKNFGIESLVPAKEEIDFIQNSIDGELLQGIFRDETKSKFKEIINPLIEKGAEGIVLGCTEIPLLLKQEDFSVPVYNTLEIHARAAVDFVLKDLTQ